MSLEGKRPNVVNLSELDKLGIEIHETHLVIPDSISDEDLLGVGVGLLNFGASWKWYMIDVMNKLVKRHGYEAMMQFFTGREWKRGTIQNMLSIGNRVPYENRSLDLAFASYEPIATIKDPDRQREWVEKARGDAEEGRPALKRSTLREEIAIENAEQWARENGKQIAGNGVGEPPPEPVYAECKRCKNCEECHGTHRIRIV